MVTFFNNNGCISSNEFDYTSSNNMKFKTLKSKVYDNTFGCIIEGEIYMCDIPKLQPLTTYIEGFKNYVKDYDWLVERYELVEVEILTLV